MGKIDELIQQYCPDGVEYKRASEVFDTCTDYTAAGSFADIAKNVKYLSEKDYALLVRTMDIKSKFTKGNVIYVNKHAYDYLWRVHFEKPCIIMPNIGNCGEIYYIEPSMIPHERAALAPNAIMLNSSTANVKYLSYILQSVEFQKALVKIVSPVGQTKFNKTDFKTLEIPVPPLPVQEEIVRILDSFTELETELETELIMRQKQYAYYREELLKFEGRDDVEWKPIGEVGEIIRGKRFVHKDDTNEGVPAIHYGELYTHYGVSATCVKTHIRSELRSQMRYAHNGDVVIVGAGENKTDIGVGVAWLGDEEVAVHDACFILTNHNQCSRYLSYCLRTEDYHRKLFPFVSEGKICSFLKDGLAQVTIPIPKDINEQERIADLLDSFDRLVSDIFEGLPSEIKMRHQQYEYYRDKLLTFSRS